MRSVVFEMLVTNCAPVVLRNRRFDWTFRTFGKLLLYLPLETIFKLLEALSYHSVTFGGMKNTLSRGKLVHSSKLRYFYSHSRIRCVVAVPENEKYIVGVVRVVIKRLFSNRLDAEHCFGRHFLADEFVVSELEFVFQVVLWLEKLQIEVGHFLVQSLKELYWQYATILIQQNISYPLHFKEKGCLRESKLLQTLFKLKFR
jgi:hypothetical protein